ncbi:cytochrome P450 [Candidatus Uabimicrobium amorphum]|uniref:Biotin biosynthesis cytochrome P450 n=1 Tax=Uabimicrobium amorphum TaxID=2596890 RepID=A0A5S9F2C8_UABAM|nr:cytochrome P450 [Candidatus Uabimicrobium amorphum]BBM82983.1 biotin biosynthesis cytochrome P450 [Candidatus Uabimicrobium amorphum]
MPSFDYNPFDPQTLENPYPCYAKLRAGESVYWSDFFNAWLCVHYDEVRTLYRHNDLSSKRVGAIVARIPDYSPGDMSHFVDSLSLWLLFCDPPQHTRIRSLVSKAFSPKFVQGMHQRVQKIVDELFESFLEKKHCDFIAEFAYPLPVIVIADMLGLPREDRDWLKEKSNSIASILGSPKTTKEVAKNANDSVKELNDYFRDVIEERRKKPQEDLISTFVGCEGEVLQTGEILATCGVLLFGGHETTTNLLGNGLYTLMNHRDEWHKLQKNVKLLPTAIEEMLRFESPVQWNTRVATQEIEIAGKTISPGQTVIMLIGSANRDERVFVEADKFDIERKENKHLAFGYGAHFCIGSALSRLEANIAFTTLLRKINNIELSTEKVDWRKDLAFRGLQKFPIQFELTSN